MSKYFIAFLLITAAIRSSAAIAETGQKPVLGFGQSRVIRVAAMKDLQPFCFQDERGENQGVLVDTWKLWSEKTGIRIEFIAGTTKEVIDMVRSGNAEAAAGIVHSQDRDSYLDFTPSPISALSSTFFFHKTILGLQTLHDLAGFKIGVIKGRYSEEFVRKNMPQAFLSPYPSLSDMTDAAEKGEIRVFIVPIENMRWMLKKRGILSEFQFNATHPLFTENLYPAVAEVNSELAEIIEQGMSLITVEERAAIERKWLVGVRTEDTLILAMGNDFPPLFFVSQQGEPAGLFVDIWRLWSQKTGQKIEFRPEIYTDAIEHIRTGKADIHIGLLKSRERETWIEFFEPLYEPHISIFFSVHDSRCSNITELSGHPVSVLGNSIAEQVLTEKYPNISIVPYESIRKIILAARDGEVHAFAAVSVVANEILSRLGLSGEFESRGEPISQVSYCPGIRKENPELYSLIQNGFDAISDKELAEIESRWISDPKHQYYKSHSKMIRLSEQEKTWIRSHTIRVGTGKNFPPFQFVENNEPVGIIPDYIRMIGERTGIRFEWIPIEWSNVDTLAKNREIDLHVSNDLPHRKEWMNFTTDLFQADFVIVSRHDMPFVSNLGSLKGKKVAVLANIQIYEQFLKNYSEIIIYPANTISEAMEAVLSRKADVYVGSMIGAAYQIQKHYQNLKIVGLPNLSDQPMLLAVRNDWEEAVHIINKAIASMSKEEHDKIIQKWLPVRFEYAANWREILKWILTLSVVFLLVLGISLFWNKRLSKEIEDRKHAEEKIRRLNEELEERVRSRTAQIEAANKELESFSYSVSHDLRAPLRSIDGWSLALAEDCADQLDNTGKKHIARIREETLRMGNLIEDMLRLSRISRCEMRITRLDLSEMVENIAARLRESASGRFAEFRIQPGLTAYADAGMMEIVLTNLLDNAWKFTKKTSETKIEFGKLGDSGRQIFFVKDNGAGFDMAYSEKLFGAFQRLHKVSEFPGTGIGLAIVQRIIHRHGGKVWAEGAVNQGAIFYFTV